MHDLKDMTFARRDNASVLAQEIDLLSMHLYPDFAVACSFQCKMEWASNTVRTKPYHSQPCHPIVSSLDIISTFMNLSVAVNPTIGDEAKLGALNTLHSTKPIENPTPMTMYLYFQPESLLPGCKLHIDQSRHS